MPEELDLASPEEVVTMTALVDDLGYWSLRVCVRDAVQRRWNTNQYEGLTGAEVIDVLEATLGGGR